MTRSFAAGLPAVADVAAARYHQQQLRFDSFSGRGGVYSRLDGVGPRLDGDEVGHGTTDVDVDNPCARSCPGSVGTIRSMCGWTYPPHRPARRACRGW